jgi:hypothetical protein
MDVVARQRTRDLAPTWREPGPGLALAGGKRGQSSPLAGLV